MHLSTIPKSVCAMALLLPCLAHADDLADLNKLLSENTYSISLENGSLAGPGAERRMRAGNGTQGVALGEPVEARTAAR